MSNCYKCGKELMSTCETTWVCSECMYKSIPYIPEQEYECTKGIDTSTNCYFGMRIAGSCLGCPNWQPKKPVEPTCPKGGEHQYGIDGMHSNRFCKKCFQNEPKPANLKPADTNLSMSQALEDIHNIAIGYDGFGTVKSLKKLIDELRDIAKKGLLGEYLVESPEPAEPRKMGTCAKKKCRYYRNCTIYKSCPDYIPPKPEPEMVMPTSQENYTCFTDKALEAHDSAVASKAVKEFAEKVCAYLKDALRIISPKTEDKVHAHIRAMAEGKE